MRPGVDNAIVFVTIASKAKLEQIGGEQSALLKMTGIIERENRRGTVVTVERIRVPLEAHGKVAIALDRMTSVNSALWVIGCHGEDRYVDEYGKEQHRLKIIVQSFEIDRILDFNRLFRD